MSHLNLIVQPYHDSAASFATWAASANNWSGPTYRYHGYCNNGQHPKRYLVMNATVP